MSGPGEELARVVTGGDPGTGVGVSSREPVDRDEDRGSMVVPNVLLPACGSAREPRVIVSTKMRGQGSEKLTRRRTEEGEKEGESQGRMGSRKSKSCVACGAHLFPQMLPVGAPEHQNVSRGMQCAMLRRLGAIPKIHTRSISSCLEPETLLAVSC